MQQSRLITINNLDMEKETLMADFLIYGIGIMATVFAVSMYSSSNIKGI